MANGEMANEERAGAEKAGAVDAAGVAAGPHRVKAPTQPTRRPVRPAPTARASTARAADAGDGVVAGADGEAVAAGRGATRATSPAMSPGPKATAHNHAGS